MQFAGEMLDPTGLFYMRARQYEPSIGRFTAVDPVSVSTDVGATTLSPYAYAGNRPTVMVDPSGRTFIPSKEASRAAGEATSPGFGGGALQRSATGDVASRSLSSGTISAGIPSICGSAPEGFTIAVFRRAGSARPCRLMCGTSKWGVRHMAKKRHFGGVITPPVLRLIRETLLVPNHIGPGQNPINVTYSARWTFKASSFTIPFTLVVAVDGIMNTITTAYIEGPLDYAPIPPNATVYP